MVGIRANLQLVPQHPRTTAQATSIGGVERDVLFIEAAADVNDQIDAAYRTKYQRYGARYVSAIVSPEA